MTISDNEERNMSDDVLNIFGETDNEQPEVAETPEQESPAPENAQPEGEKAENPAESTGENEAEPPAAKTEEDQRQVPYEALRDERTKRQGLREENADLKQKVAQYEALLAQQRIQSIEDPDERRRAAEAYNRQLSFQNDLQRDFYYASRMHGEDLVREAWDFYDRPENRFLTHAFARSQFPIEAMVADYKQRQIANRVGGDLDAYVERIAKERIAAELEKLSPTKPKAPPRSMASAPAAGGDSNPIGSGFDALFGES